MKTLAVIPARGGSKGIPGKNKKLLHGKPLTTWAIEFAMKLDFEAISVSSDDEEILSLANPFARVHQLLRPIDLSGDAVSDQPVLWNAKAQTEAITGVFYDRVVMLQPTAPGRDLEEMSEALNQHETLADPLNSSTWSVSPVPQHFHPDKQIIYLEAPQVNRRTSIPPRRQDLSPSFIRNGNFYILGSQVLQDSYLIGKHLDLYVSTYSPINIDTLEDFSLAEGALSPEGLVAGSRLI